MKYRHERSGREMEVGKHERVRRQILERIGWQLVEDAPESEPAKPTPIQGEEDLSQLSGVGKELHDALYSAGFQSLNDLRAASDEELLAISGIGKRKLEDLRKQL